MDKKEKTNKRSIRIISWTMIVSTLAAIGGQFSARVQKQKEFCFDMEKLCGACGANNSFSNLPVDEPSGFGGSWGGQPLLPPGGDHPIVFPRHKYTGPNTIEYYEQPEFVVDYFQNLCTNYPRNLYEQNCGYVAATMLLSYYDTYWNPNFIPDQYNNTNQTILDSLGDKEFDSPGVKDIYEDIWVDCEPMAAPTANSSQDYKVTYYSHYYDYVQRMLAHKDESFVAYLYQKSIETGCFNPEVYPVPRTVIPNVEIFVNKYFSENPSLSGKVVMRHVRYETLNGFTDEEKRETLSSLAIERLKKGQPIIFGGDLDGGGHICIAYDYVEGNNGIICHLGFKGRENNRWRSKYRFNNFNDFAYLDISPELRTIPQNYRFLYNDTVYSCHDLDSFLHKEKTICYEDENFHAIQCSCGDLRYEKHNFVYISNDTKRCTVCGKTISTPTWSN